MNLTVLIAISANVIALIYILAYRRNGARYRAPVSWLAWALAVSLAGSAWQMLAYPRPVSFFETATAVLLASFVLCARGNVARLLGDE